MREQLYRFLSSFKSPAGGLISLGLLPRIPEWLGLIWHRIADLGAARDAWVAAGGTVPEIVTFVSSIWFTLTMFALGFFYAFYSWRIEKHGAARAVGIWINRVGWVVVGVAAMFITATIFFDQFLVGANALQFAERANQQRDDRSLSDAEVKKLVDIFKNAPPFAEIHVAAISDPYAIRYAQQFILAFLAANLKVNGVAPGSDAEVPSPEIATLYDPDERGLLLAVTPNTPIPLTSEAIRFVKLMSAAGFSLIPVSWNGMSKDQIELVIGPKR